MAPDHQCLQKDKIDTMKEDLTILKTRFGIKETINGELKTELIETDKNLNERMTGLETSVNRIESSLSTVRWTLTLLLPILVGLGVEMFLK